MQSESTQYLDLDGVQIPIQPKSIFVEFCEAHHYHNLVKKFASICENPVVVIRDGKDDEIQIAQMGERIFNKFYEILLCKDCSQAVNIGEALIL